MTKFLTPVYQRKRTELHQILGVHVRCQERCFISELKHNKVQIRSNFDIFDFPVKMREGVGEMSEFTSSAYD